MANNDQVSQEYLLIKCFLYKYTPPFTAVGDVSDSLSTFSPYSIPLDNTKYFTKYDISGFITSYSFGQKIDETTFSWSVELQDLALSYSTINTKLKVLPPNGNPMRGGLSFSRETNSTNLLSVYETNASNIENNSVANAGSSNSLNTVNPILAAKQRRGSSPGPLTSQNVNLNKVQSTTPGIRLSDLIQEYDFVSVYLYKSLTPITDIWGTFTVDETLDNNPIQIFNYKVTSDIKPAFTSYKNPLDPYIQYESVLNTVLPNGKSLFSNEFNGFVMKKNVVSSANAVDRVTISGNGWSRLFGSTRRLIKPSLFQNALYQAGQVLSFSDVAAFESVYSGRTIPEIVKDLFDLVYRIDFNTSKNTVVPGVVAPINQSNSTNLATSTQNGSSFFASPTGATAVSTSAQVSDQLILANSFYNITSLVVANDYPVNLFNLPQYLLASVMKLRPFAYIEPINVPSSQGFIDGAQAYASSLASSSSNLNQPAPLTLSPDTQVSPEIFQKAIQTYNNGEQSLNYAARNPVFVDPNLQNLVAYFKFLAPVFQQFNPDLQTPYEILDQVRAQSFVEIFEQPNGQFIVRSPQYNNMAQSITGRSDIGMIRSSNLNVVSSAYSETVENLATKLFVGYSPNMTPISQLQQFAYCDGKLLIQNGLLETVTAANPNAATASTSNEDINNSKTTGIFGYAEYLMTVMNARLKTASISCDLDNTVQVGQTYLDESKFKFGYIIGLTKQVSVTGTAIMSLELSYVRDAVPTYSVTNDIVSINTDLLPVLTDIENSFATGQ